jgi:hypothetical protein
VAPCRIHVFPQVSQAFNYCDAAAIRPSSHHHYYLTVLWLRVALAAFVVGLIHGLAVRPGEPALVKAVQVILAGVEYAGAPYLILAVWASWWMRHQREPEIRRLAIRAPLLLLAVFVPFAFVISILSGGHYLPRHRADRRDV